MSGNHDYSDYNDASVMNPVEQVKEGLQKIVDEADGYSVQVRYHEAQMKKAAENLRSIVEDLLPKALKQAGFGDVPFPTKDGRLISVEAKLTTSVLAARREESFDWLEKNGHGDIVKTEVSIPFVVGEVDVAKALRVELEKKFGRTVDCSRKVEPSTLKKAVKNMLEAQKTEENAVIVPRDLFGIREFDVATFEVPKKKV